MPKMSIQLFGKLSVRHDGFIINGFEARKVQELFCYLLLNRHHTISRESLANLMWSECTTAQAKKKLRQTLWRLQCALNSQSKTTRDQVLLVEPKWVRINEEADLWLDVAIFEKTFEFVQSLTGQELDAQKVQALQKAVELYQDPLLEGCYDDWCLYEREQLHNMYLVMLEKLMVYCEIHKDYDVGILYGMRIIYWDKARERTHRQLMRLYYLNGDRAAALRQYEQCITILDEELGVKPSKRTISIYKQILAEQLVEQEPITASTTEPPALTYISNGARQTGTLAPTNPQSLPEFSTSPNNEMLVYLIQLQEFLANLQNELKHSIQKFEQALNYNSNPSHSTNDNQEKTLQRPPGDVKRH